jgi:hypothetical protein
MGVVERHVGHEVAHGLAVLGPPVGRAERGAHVLRDPVPRQCDRALHERRGAPAREVVERSAGSETDQPRRPASGGHGDAGVAQHHPGQPVLVRHRPPLHHGTAPVLPDHHERSLEPERADRIVEIAHAIRVAAQADAIAVPHVQLVDGDDAPAIAEPLDDPVPQVRPGGVAVDADDRAERTRRRGGTAFEHVPAVRRAVVRRHVEHARPRGIDAPSLPVVGTRECRHAHRAVVTRRAR